MGPSPPCPTPGRGAPHHLGAALSQRRPCVHGLGRRHIPLPLPGVTPSLREGRPGRLFSRSLLRALPARRHRSRSAQAAHGSGTWLLRTTSVQRGPDRRLVRRRLGCLRTTSVRLHRSLAPTATSTAMWKVTPRRPGAAPSQLVEVGLDLGSSFIVPAVGRSEVTKASPTVSRSQDLLRPRHLAGAAPSQRQPGNREAGARRQSLCTIPVRHHRSYKGLALKVLAAYLSPRTIPVQHHYEIGEHDLRLGIPSSAPLSAAPHQAWLRAAVEGVSVGTCRGPRVVHHRL